MAKKRRKVRTRINTVTGKLVPVTPRVTHTAIGLQHARYEKILLSLNRWRSKLSRAQTAIGKLEASRKRYEKLFRAAILNDTNE